MRILELQLDGDAGTPIKLHPNLTLVHGLDDEHRRRFTDAVRGMGRGTTSATGLVEAHGVIFDLTPASLQLLGLTSDVDAGLDPIVRRDELPGYDRQAAKAADDLERAEADRLTKLSRLERARAVLTSVVDARTALLAAIEDNRRVDAERADEVVRTTTELARARQERHRARSIREMVEQELADARRSHQALVDSRDATSDALARLRTRHHERVEACAAAAAKVRDAHRALTDLQAEIDRAQQEVDDATHAADHPVAGDADATADASAEASADEGRRAPSTLFTRKSDGGRSDGDAGGSVAVTTRPDPSDGPTDADQGRLEELQERRREAAHELESLSAPAQVTEVRRARDEVAAMGPSPRNPDAEQARALADRWRELGRELDAFGWDGEDEDGSGPDEPAEPEAVAEPEPEPEPEVLEPKAVADARSQLAQARQTREEAQAALDLGSAGPDQVRALEAAHTAVLDAQERTESRFGGGKAQRKLDAARAEEREILDRLGFTTYADYMMSSSNRFSNGVDHAVLDTADRALIAARQGFVKAWRDEYGEEPPFVPCPPKVAPVPEGAEVAPPPEPEPEPEPPAVDPALAALREDRVDVRTKAEALVGRPLGDDVAAELDAHVLAFGPPPDHAGDQLAGLLRGVGVRLEGERLGRGTLVEYADAWLNEQQVGTWRRAELEAEIDQIDRDVVRWQDMVAAHRDHRAAAAAAETERRAQAAAAAANAVGNARRRLEELQRDGGTAPLQTELERRQAELEVRTAEEREAAEALDAAQVQPPSVATDDQVAAAEARLAEAQRAHENALADEQAATAAVSAVEQAFADGTDPAAHDLAELEVRLDAVDQDRQRAESELVTAEADLEIAEHTVQAMIDAESSRRQERARNQLSKGSLLEDIDWYLLSRLASQRSVSVVGSMPLVVDDAFAELPPTEANWLIGRLERMTGAVQVIVLTDRPEAAAWVSDLGDERGAVVHT